MNNAIVKMLRQLYVKNSALLISMCAHVPGAGILLLEVSDLVDDLPETVFDPTTAALAAVAMCGAAVQWAIKKYGKKEVVA